NDSILFYEPDNTLFPGYADTINHFWVYRFDTPLVLPAGTFYAGIFIPAYSGSDSLYVGLDVNRIGNNHVFYNVDGVNWYSSQVSGALMMRPLLGQGIRGTKVDDIQAKQEIWSLSPNPARDIIHFDYSTGKFTSYKILDVEGRAIMMGALDQQQDINISNLLPGVYIAHLIIDGVDSAPQKFIKL
ncbi:MAG TPA: T9SS type A sorting domain-containing protein, partial [Flavipsychrobacter sp.]|nr:T9SS type A sorting domain-containing protein [Flavipsychrobacter sp.]